MSCSSPWNSVRRPTCVPSGSGRRSKLDKRESLHSTLREEGVQYAAARRERRKRLTMAPRQGWKSTRPGWGGRDLRLSRAMPRRNSLERGADEQEAKAFCRGHHLTWNQIRVGECLADSAVPIAAQDSNLKVEATRNETKKVHSSERTSLLRYELLKS